jgi:hypothetical protein
LVDHRNADGVTNHELRQAPLPRSWETGSRYDRGRDTAVTSSPQAHTTWHHSSTPGPGCSARCANPFGVPDRINPPQLAVDFGERTTAA